jgi:sugar phosphate isomerase/epimerase
MNSNRIFVSTSKRGGYLIAERLDALLSGGFKNIELSGGCVFQSDILKVLEAYQKKYNLNYRMHNYFPPPELDFAFNLSANCIKIIEQSELLFRNAIKTCNVLGIKEFGIHAGFRQNFNANDLGSVKSTPNLISDKLAKSNFKKNFLRLSAYAEKHGVQIYVENNVIGAQNFRKFDYENPFLLTSSKDIYSNSFFKKCNLLADIAHLKVSCNILGLDFEEETKFFLQNSDYIHLSDNAGLEDTNDPLSIGGEIYNVLKNNCYLLKNKKITLEVYGEISEIKESVSILHGLVECDFQK